MVEGQKSGLVYANQCNGQALIRMAQKFLELN